MNAVIAKAGLSEKVACDSAGTMDWHTGKSPDSRMILAAADHGYQFRGAARQIRNEDFGEFDLILAMDQRNLNDLKSICPPAARDKIKLFLDFAPHLSVSEVPDPYYGGDAGFDHVLDLVEAASDGLIEKLKH